jgi:branched-chain amino acid transport system ATP-binding protein
MLKTENLRKSFGKIQAIDGISVELGKESGKMTFIVGPNGAGKTTFINLLTGRVAPDTGTIFLDETDITTASPTERIHSGLVRSFQLVHVFDEMTVRENIRTVLFSREGLSKKLFTDETSYDEIEEEIEELLRQFRILNEEHELAKNLSHGDRKLLDVAITFGLNPEYLLLDEPTSGVGSKQKDRLIDTVVDASMEYGIKTITIEHDMDIVTEYGDRVISLHNGQILSDGGPEIIETDDELRSVLLGLDND